MTNPEDNALVEAVALAKAKWAGDDDTLPPNADVDIIGIDPSARLSRALGVSGVVGSIACWVRYWPEEWDFARFRSCDLGELDITDDEWAKLFPIRQQEANNAK